MKTSAEYKLAKPFFKWVGGKTQLLDKLTEFFPIELKQNKIKKYFEPFLGGGAMFFHIVQHYSVESARLNDINGELILAYRVIQRNPEDLLEFLYDYTNKYNSSDESDQKKYYYEIRDSYNSERVNINYYYTKKYWIPRTAQMIFLNKTCYNGLFRVNKAGKFNVPFGRYKHPKIYEEDNIRKISELLQKAEIRKGTFGEALQGLDESSFVYFDPPYRPISPSSSFTSYAQSGFGDKEQKKLSQKFAELDKESGAKLMLSNSDPQNLNSGDDFFDKLYEGFHIERVFARRMVNCNADKRGKISELLITNYRNA